MLIFSNTRQEEEEKIPSANYLRNLKTHGVMALLAMMVKLEILTFSET